MTTEYEANFPNTEEERWKYLFSSINNLSESLKTVRAEIHTSSKFVESIDRRVNEFENRLTQSESSLSALESLSRARNIILFNLMDTDEINTDLHAMVLKTFKKVNLQVPDLAIDDVFRLGKIRGKRPIMIKFISSKWVRLVFGKVRELRNEDIFIANDRSKEERENRRLLLDQVRRIREGGQDAVLKGNKIIIKEKNNIDDKQTPLSTSMAQNLPRPSRKRTVDSPSVSVSGHASKETEKAQKKRKGSSKSAKRDRHILESLDGYLNSPSTNTDDLNQTLLPRKLTFEK